MEDAPASTVNSRSNSALASYQRLIKRVESLENHRRTLEIRLLTEKREVKQAELAMSYMEEEMRTKNDEYQSLTDELKHRDQQCKAFHSQISRLTRQVEDLHLTLGVGRQLQGSRSTTSLSDLLPDAVSLGLNQALRSVDVEEQTLFTLLNTKEERLRAIKGNLNAIDRSRVTVLIKNVDPRARNRAANTLQRSFIATDGLTFQQVLEESLRFWNMLPADDQPESAFGDGNNNDADGNGSSGSGSSSAAESQSEADKPRFCLADEGGALRFGHMLVSNDIAASDATKDDLVLSYLLFSLPKLDLGKVREFSGELEKDGFENEDEEDENEENSDDEDEDDEDEENRIEFFRYDAVLSNTPLLVKDMIFFVSWLLLWIIVAVVRRDVSYDNQVALLSKHWLAERKWDGETPDRWVDFESIATTEEWWSWVQGPMSLTMSVDEGMSRSLDFGVSKQGSDGGNAGGTFVLYGGWRLRQARVPPNCLDKLSNSIKGKSVKNDPKKKFDNYYGDYSRVFCYSTTPFGPLNNNSMATTVVSIKHFVETVVGNQSTYSTTSMEHTISKMTETPDQDTIALKYRSYDPFKKSITPPINDLDTVAWLKAFLFYPAPTPIQRFDNAAMGPFKDYRNADYFDTGPKQGLISDYGGSGYVLELPANLTTGSLSYRLQKLKENKWIDKQTRAVLARANFFNVNSGQWAVVDALAEWDQSGKMKTLFRATPILADQYYTIGGKVGGLLSVFVFIGALSFLYQQLSYWKTVRQHLRADKSKEMRRYLKRASFPVTMTWLSSVWTLLELGVVLPCLAARGLDLIMFFESKRHFDLDLPYYRSLTYLVWLFEDKNAMDSLGVVFAFVKMFKYFAIHIKLQIISQTISKAASLMFSWVLLFSFLFCAFSLVAHQVWGRQIEEFQSVARSLRTMLQVSLRLKCATTQSGMILI